MPDPIRIRANHANGVTEVKMLVAHPMEGGLRKDKDGKIVPNHFITEIVSTYGGKTVLKCLWSQAVSQNPYLAFSFKGGAKGEKIQVSWIDNKGETRSDEAAIA